MSEKEVNQDNYEEYEINLRELVLGIWKQKKVIAIITGAVVILTAVVILIAVKPVYQSESTFILNTQPTASTRFGDFTFPSGNVFSDYVQYVKNNSSLDKIIAQNNLDIDRSQLKKNITIDYEKRDFDKTAQNDNRVYSNMVTVGVTNKDAQIAQKINNELLQNYDEYMRISAKKDALNYFIKTYKIRIENEKSEVTKNETILQQKKELLQSLDSTYTLKKALFDNPSDAIKYDSKNAMNDIMDEEYRNEDYDKLNAECISKGSLLIEQKNELAKDEVLYEQLLAENDTFTKAVESDDSVSALNGVADVFENAISISVPASLPDTILPRHRVKYMAIALLIGLFLGLIVAIFKCWLEKK
jgi:capsular polysaccharide biosynthesis protein